VTVIDFWTVPPAPVQSRAKLVVAARAAVVSLPEVGLLPVHPPLALHDVALVDVQLSCVVPFMFTVVGLASKESVGVAAAVTLTVALDCALPPLPVQDRP